MKTIVGSLAKPWLFLSTTRPVPRREERSGAAWMPRHTSFRKHGNLAHSCRHVWEYESVFADPPGSVFYGLRLAPAECLPWALLRPRAPVPGQFSHSQAIVLLPWERRLLSALEEDRQLIYVLLTLKILFLILEWFVSGPAPVLGLRFVWEVLGYKENANVQCKMSVSLLVDPKSALQGFCAS